MSKKPGIKIIQDAIRKKYQYGSISNYALWSSEILKNYGINIVLDDYRKSLLIFDSWKGNYITGKMKFSDLEQQLKAENTVLPNFIDFCEFALDLTTLDKHQKAIDLLIYTNEKIQNMGQVYAFLGDVHFARGDKNSAKECYLKCLQTYPGYPMAVKGLTKIK